MVGTSVLSRISDLLTLLRTYVACDEEYEPRFTHCACIFTGVVLNLCAMWCLGWKFWRA